MISLRAVLIAAIATAVFALALFGAVHAVLLVPIWSRLLSGLPFTLVGALALGWAFTEVASAEVLPKNAATAGLTFGFGAWAALLPATALATAFRLTGLHSASPDITSYVELGAAGLTGLLLGLGLRRGWRGLVALSLAAMVLLAVQAGPVPIVNGARALGLFLALAAVYAMSGVVLSVLSARLTQLTSTAGGISGRLSSSLKGNSSG